jgi:lathosterol oxidase
VYADWVHRLLHTKWLYRNVHKVHHQSVNPNPLSGLSMHPLESALYFSAAPLVAVLATLWMSRLMIKMLVLAPLQGHHGHSVTEDGLMDEHSCWHYIHHAKFNWNFGANPFWDRVIGTAWDGRDYRPKARVRRKATLHVSCREFSC